VVPFLTLILFRGPYSILFIYVLGRIASLANDFAYPLLAKYVYHGYDGSIMEWWIWIFGLGPDDRFSWIVKMPFVTYQMTSAIMGINLAVRILIISAFFLTAHLF